MIDSHLTILTCTPTTARRLMLALLPLLLAAATASGEEQNSDLPYHHLSLFAGLGIESKTSTTKKALPSERDMSSSSTRSGGSGLASKAWCCLSL